MRGTLIPHLRGLCIPAAGSGPDRVSSEPGLCDSVRMYIDWSSHLCHLRMHRWAILVCALTRE